MAALFDKNGNATETHIVTVSSFYPATGEFKTTYDVRILAGTGIPAYTTMMIAPVIKAGFAACWNGADWVEVTDLRGHTSYKKADGTAHIIKSLGDLDDAFTSLEPSTPYDQWNGSEWVTDLEALHVAEVANAELQKAALRTTADAEIEWRNDAVNTEGATEEEEADLAEWRKHRVLLMRVITSRAPDIEWPTLPAVES